MVILSDNDLKQLYAFRLGVVKLQRDLRERQAQLDTAERTLAAAKRAADSAGTKVSPELKAQIAAVEKELTDVTREMGSAAGGRGGAGRGGARRAAAVVHSRLAAVPPAADVVDVAAVAVRAARAAEQRRSRKLVREYSGRRVPRGRAEPCGERSGSEPDRAGRGRKHSGAPRHDDGAAQLDVQSESGAEAPAADATRRSAEAGRSREEGLDGSAASAAQGAQGRRRRREDAVTAAQRRAAPAGCRSPSGVGRAGCCGSVSSIACNSWSRRADCPL